MSTKEQVILNDNRIFDLAVYAVSEGMTKKIHDVTPVDATFVEYKRLIKSGEFTLDELEDDVCSKYGIVAETDLADKEVNNFAKFMQGLKKPNKGGC